MRARPPAIALGGLPLKAADVNIEGIAPDITHERDQGLALLAGRAVGHADLSHRAEQAQVIASPQRRGVLRCVPAVQKSSSRSDRRSWDNRHADTELAHKLAQVLDVHPLAPARYGSRGGFLRQHVATAGALAAEMTGRQSQPGLSPLACHVMPSSYCTTRSIGRLLLPLIASSQFTRP